MAQFAAVGQGPRCCGPLCCVLCLRGWQHRAACTPSARTACCRVLVLNLLVGRVRLCLMMWACAMLLSEVVSGSVSELCALPLLGVLGSQLQPAG